MKPERFQIDTTRTVREDTKEAARRRGMKLGAFVHRALAKEDPGLARVIGEELGIVMEPQNVTLQALQSLEAAVAEIDYLMNEGVIISRAELDKLKALAEALDGIVRTYEEPILRLVEGMPAMKPHTEKPSHRGPNDAGKAPSDARRAP
jgi:hypothetical protein